MRVVLVLCLCATALAVPQGYNYQHQQQHQPQQQQQTSSFQVPNLSFIQEAFKKTNLPSILAGGQTAQSQQQQQYSAPSHYNKPAQQIQSNYASFPTAQQQQHQQPQQSYFTQNLGGQQQKQYQQAPQQFQQQQHYAPTPAPITKDIYVHVAPEEQEQPQYQEQLPPVPPRKHYRIVFIKAPTPKVSSAALRISQAPIEEKTIIYVLTKKPDPLDLQAAIQEAQPKQPSKPEVYFIKYKTQEEAQHAQRTIQAQYDQLGGTTQVSDEGIAPVTSVIGSLDNKHAHGGHSLSSSQSSSSSSSSIPSTSYGVPATSSNYFPAIVKL